MTEHEGSAACDASVALGDILLVRCTERGEHVAHEGPLATECRRDGLTPQGGWPSKRTRIYWYDGTGTVMVVTKDDE